MKKISILGDSISTYIGWNPPGYAVYYEGEYLNRSGLRGPDETWWGRVLARFGWTLLSNGSWSGSFTAGMTDASARSQRRIDDLSEDGEAPDLIFVCMGANDCGGRISLHGRTEDDEFGFDSSYRTMLRRIRCTYPRARVFCATIMLTDLEVGSERAYRQIESYNDVIRTVCAEEACELLDTFDPENGYTTTDGLHPDREGHKMMGDRFITLLSGKGETI